MTRSTAQYSATSNCFVPFPVPGCALSAGQGLCRKAGTGSALLSRTLSTPSPSRAHPGLLTWFFMALCSSSFPRLSSACGEETWTGDGKELESSNPWGSPHSAGLISASAESLSRECKVQRGPLNCTTSTSQGLELSTSSEMKAPECAKGKQQFSFGNCLLHHGIVQAGKTL